MNTKSRLLRIYQANHATDVVLNYIGTMPVLPNTRAGWLAKLGSIQNIPDELQQTLQEDESKN